MRDRIDKVRTLTKKDREIAATTTDQILSHMFTAVVDEMSWVLVRSAYTTFIKETQDFATAIVSKQGEVAAYPRNTGVVAMLGTPMQPAVRAFDDWAPGDIMCTNDPYSTEGMVTHLNDIFLFKPVFAGGEIVCFAFAFIHCTDIGGAVPGSIDMRHHEVFQEGLRLRPVKLYKQGVFNQELWNIISDNSRIPALNRGDIDAAVSAINKAETRLLGLIDKYGKEAVERAIDRSLDRTETISRQALARIPAGEYRFSEYIEDDYVSNVPIRLEVKLTSRGDGTMELDFTGSDPQVKSALNIPSGGQKHHPFFSRNFLNFLITVVPTITLNAGMLRCIELVLPKGSVVNCEFPAAVGMRATTSVRLHDAVLGCLMQAIPDIVPAGGTNQVAVTYVALPGTTGGGRVVVANPIQGGSGGSAQIDGISGSDRPLAHLRNVPTEILEHEAPIRVHRLALSPDSEGAGRQRGGFGIEYDVELLHPEAVLVMRGKDRHRFSAWGALGGQAGSPCDNYSRFDGDNVHYIGKGTVYRPRPGEIVTIKGGGGGGYGNPLQRQADKVLRDHLAGLVSLERARSVYGVVIDGGKVNAKATEALRASPSEPTDQMFDFGAGRNKWLAAYGSAADVIRDWLWSLPSDIRGYCREQAWQRLDASGSAPFTSDDAHKVICELHDFLGRRNLI
ncbi:hypothetical protein N182_37550 [Sinorhizobium sp. GL2]|nr:hypothetical protein N182_37550 [Sinorhizobium sp. GL2]